MNDVSKASIFNPPHRAAARAPRILGPSAPFERCWLKPKPRCVNSSSEGSRRHEEIHLRAAPKNYPNGSRDARAARMDEAIEGLRQERLELQREVAHDRAFQQLQLKRKRWLADHERRRHGGTGLIYKVRWDARIR